MAKSHLTILKFTLIASNGACNAPCPGHLLFVIELIEENVRGHPSQPTLPIRITEPDATIPVYIPPHKHNLT